MDVILCHCQHKVSVRVFIWSHDQHWVVVGTVVHSALSHKADVMRVLTEL